MDNCQSRERWHPSRFVDVMLKNESNKRYHSPGHYTRVWIQSTSHIKASPLLPSSEPTYTICLPQSCQHLSTIPPDWDNLSWASEQEWTPTESRASSEHSGTSTSTVRFASQIGNADAAARRTSGAFSYHEWLRINPDQPHRPQYDLLRLIVMRAWGWLGSVKQKFINICMWLRD